LIFMKGLFRMIKHSTRFFLVMLILTVSMVVLVLPAAAQDEDNPIVWAFVPSADSETVMAGASQITDLVFELTGIYIEPVVATDFSGVIEAMCNGEAQMGALNTFSYVLAHGRACADVAMVSTRFGATYYTGQIIVLNDSGIETIADLEGKTFCRPDPLSTSGWIIPSITMQANGLNPEMDLEEIVDAGGHGQVVTAVVNGDCDAGATYVDARDDEQKELTTVITESAPIPNDTISFASDFDGMLAQQITDALVKIAADDANADLLSETYNWGGLVPAEDAFFDDFRQDLDAAGIMIDELMPAASDIGTEDDPIIWAFVPSADSETVLAGASQITDLVFEQTGLYIEPVVATDFSGVIEAMCNGEAHMGALNTFSYVLAHGRDCADVAMVSTRFGATYYTGQIIVLNDSGIETIADLAGKTFCRPDPLSTSGWIIPSITMQANGLSPEMDLEEIVDAGGHGQVVTAVVNGDCDAGATYVDARDDEQKELTTVITESSPIPNDTISFASDFDAMLMQQITDALVVIAADEANADLLSDTYNWGGLVPAEDAFFDDFRQDLDAAGIDIEELN
jgi:phosphonate transport system substrate-binding protein